MPDHGTLARRRYGLLAPEGPTGYPATAGPQGNRGDPEDTTGTGDTNRRETRTVEQDR